jgi:hypothetical protein
VKFVLMNSDRLTVERGGMMPERNRYRLTFRDDHSRMHVCEVTASSMSIAESERKDPSELLKIERIDPDTGVVLGGRYSE